MSRVYLGFDADLRRVLDRMREIAVESKDDWWSAASLVPGLEAKIRDQLALEHLVHCYRLKHGTEHNKPLPQQDKIAPAARAPVRQTGKEMLAALGVSAADVRAWAIYQGLTTSLRGQIGVDIIELYALAHEEQEERSA